MKIRIYIISLLSLLILGSHNSLAQTTIELDGIKMDVDSLVLDDAFLDSVDVKKSSKINDYTMIGIQYGMGLNQMSWNPRMQQKMQFTPYNFGVTWTRYGKMFGYMPYFGIQAGLFYAQEGYQLDEGYLVSGADAARYEVIELPAMAHCHFDFWQMKLMVNIGLYVSYRLSVERFGENVPPAIQHEFLPTDRRFDYGIKGGAGFAFVFDPVEIHFTAMYKYGFASLYEPDYLSQYYYRFSSVSNFIFSVGLHFQLTKRVGKTTRELKQEAKRLYNEQNLQLAR